MPYHLINFKSRPKLSDADIVVGVQAHNEKVEKYFFDAMDRYFNLHFNQLFFDQDSRQEVFQRAIIKLWTEIENKTIRVIEDKVCRRKSAGQYQVMTASLTTFFMAFAKFEFRELLRNCSDDNFLELTSSNVADTLADSDDDPNQEHIRIVDECILEMSPHCIEIITLFYYSQKSLDEIMAIRKEQNCSKDGLKSAKNKCMVTLRKFVSDRINKQ